MLPQINTIYSYFRAIKEKDIDKLVDMFEDDAAQLRDNVILSRSFKLYAWQTRNWCMIYTLKREQTIMEHPYYAPFKEGKRSVHDSAFDLVPVHE